ncbi:MAG: VWA domain-containing protein [Deltaproteobacteria bacterium]|nr:VWA domain-containing protein [Deltaproteobacteria bacterium]
MVAHLADEASHGDDARTIERALEELEDNVTSVERATVVRGQVPVGYVAWLGRLHALVSRAASTLGPRRDPTIARIFAGTSPLRWAPPLSIAVTRDGAADESDVPADDRATEPSPEHGRTSALQPGRPDLIALVLGAADRLIEAAEDEQHLLGRRRRLFEAARQVLLDAAAALPLDQRALGARRDHVSRAITRIDRLEGAGLALDVALLHQARGALSSRDRSRLHAALVALDGAAVSTGDPRVSALTAEALRRLRRDSVGHSASARRASLARSADEVLGRDVADTVSRTYAHAVERYRSAKEAAPDDEARDHAQRALDYLKDGAAGTLTAALHADGCFEVGGTLSPLRVIENEIHLEPVRHPTRDLALLAATEVSDLPDAVIEDPRTVLLSLVAGRLLVRRYVREQVRPRPRTVMAGEVRVYVLDGSGSMTRARARMRDAILVAELATLARRVTEAGRRARLRLYFQYFDTKLGPVHEVETAGQALAAIDAVLGTVRDGGTDIDLALLSSFEQVRAAREVDRELGRAHVVLVTDGADTVDERAIVAARERAGDIPIGVSVIAIGQENPALRSLVARQRARGERAFYHFVDDETLAALVEGRDDGPPIHLPDLSADVARHGGDDDLEALVGEIVEELAELGRARDLSALERLDAEAAARAEMGLSDSILGEAERARVEVLHRDRRALERRFARWFPEPVAGAQKLDPHAMPPAGSAQRAEIDAVLVLLTTLLDVVEVTGGSTPSRRADAIEMLERMLVDARLSPTRYQAVLATHAVALSPALSALHAAVARGG